MDPDPTFHFNADPDPTFHLMRCLSKWCEAATTNQQILQGSNLSLHASIVSVYGSLRLHCEPLKLLNPDPYPAFHSNADPDPASQNNAYSCGSGSATLLTIFNIYSTQKICGSRAMKMLNFIPAKASEKMDGIPIQCLGIWECTGSYLNRIVIARFKMWLSGSFVTIFFTCCVTRCIAKPYY